MVTNTVSREGICPHKIVKKVPDVTITVTMNETSTQYFVSAVTTKSLSVVTIDVTEPEACTSTSLRSAADAQKSEESRE